MEVINLRAHVSELIEQTNIFKKFAPVTINKPLGTLAKKKTKNHKTDVSKTRNHRGATAADFREIKRIV